MKRFIYAPILCFALGCASSERPVDNRYVFQALPADLAPSNVAPPKPTAPVKQVVAPTAPILETPKPAKPAPVTPAPMPGPARAPAQEIFDEPKGYQISVKPVHLLNGRIVNLQDSAGIVVVNFPVGQLPALGSKLAVYRNGARVGEIMITGPQRDDNIAADIISGEIKVGDEARDR